MERLFVPYTGRKPATVMVNGHRLVIVSQSRRQLQEGLESLGATKVRELSRTDTPDLAAEELARKAQARIVLPPPNIRVQDVLASLHESLPWMH